MQSESFDSISSWCWNVRKISSALGMFIVLFRLYTYQNINKINNQLLLKISSEQDELIRTMSELQQGRLLTPSGTAGEQGTTTDDMDNSISDNAGIKATDQDACNTFDSTPTSHPTARGVIRSKRRSATPVPPAVAPGPRSIPHSDENHVSDEDPEFLDPEGEASNMSDYLMRQRSAQKGGRSSLIRGVQGHEGEEEMETLLQKRRRTQQGGKETPNNAGRVYMTRSRSRSRSVSRPNF